MENVVDAITRLPMNRLGWNVGGRIQPTPLPNIFFLVLVVTDNRTVNVLVLWGVEIKNIHIFM